MLGLTRCPRRTHGAAKSTLYLTLPDGRIVTLVVASIEESGRVRLLLDAPADVQVRRADAKTGEKS